MNFSNHGEGSASPEFAWNGTRRAVAELRGVLRAYMAR